MLGLPMSTALTGIVFIVLLVVWKEASRTDQSLDVGEALDERT
jgi:hypothetical protein